MLMEFTKVQLIFTRESTCHKCQKIVSEIQSLLHLKSSLQMQTSLQMKKYTNIKTIVP